MSISTASPLAAADLEQLLFQTDPAALLVPPRILRRVIKQDRGIGGVGLQVPHRKSYVIARDALFSIADRDELGVAAGRELPATLLLLPQPDLPRLQLEPAEATLLKYWRLLFHAQVHVALDERRRSGQLDDATLRARIHQIGYTEFEEIRAVLRQEHFLLPPSAERTVYEEFISLYLELRQFAPHLLRRYFPTLNDLSLIDRLAGQDVPADEVFRRTRLPGAAEPGQLDEGPSEETRWYRHLMTRADRKSAGGNMVRAAILRQRALLSATPRKRPLTEAAAQGELDHLLERLQNALELSDSDTERWRQALTPLLVPAAQGIWPVEARLLYDIQKVCIDQERDIYTIDLVEWVISWGKKPIKRALPNQKLVLLVRHLRSALHRLTAAHLPDEARQELAALLTAAIHHAEKALHDELQPLVSDALTEVGLKPANFPEQVARDKLVEELLDRVVERGFLNMGDLRDALARNRLKLRDLKHPVEFVTGDPMIRANRQLAISLDGVYRRGEVYLRWLQRFSSMSFGTRVGRFLTRYVALPFGGAYLVLEGLQHVLVDPLWAIFGPARLPREAAITSAIGLMSDPLGLGPLLVGSMAAVRPHKPHLLNLYSFLVMAGFLLGLLHWPAFRAQVMRGLQLAGLGLRGLFYTLPVTVLNLPMVRRILQSRSYLFFYQFIFKPLVWALPVPLVLYLAGVDPGVNLVVTLLVFATASLLFNSRLGMHLEEVCTDGLVRTWQLVSTDIVPGLFRFVVFIFKWLIDEVEQLMYTVDEWLRFRPGDNRVSIWLKGVLGLLWFFITYIVRFCVNLLIEPQINPIKHFPVVTVSHKLVLTLGVPPLASLLETVFDMHHAEALGMAALIGSLIPGIFGFLVWELKENWRLYAANQSPTLNAVIVGSHGETVLRLMRPGFHSGTLPKLFARLRRSERRHLDRAARKQRELLHHVREGLQHFVDRELLALLAGSRCWGLTVEVGAIHLATRRIRIELTCAELGDDALAIDFEENSGWLAARIARPGWIRQLTPTQRRTLTDALAGFYKLAGVDLVHEQIDFALRVLGVIELPEPSKVIGGEQPLANLTPAGSSNAITDAGLLVWRGTGFTAATVYELNGEPELKARAILGTPDVTFPSVPAERLEFRLRPLHWKDWVETWERDRGGKEHAPPLAAGVELLPA
jgi:hypothetical protein